MNFNLDESLILDSIAEALENAGADTSEKQFYDIMNEIDEKFPDVIATLTYGMQEHWKAEAKSSGTGWGSKYAAAIKARVTGDIGEVYVDENMMDKMTNKPSIMFVKMVEEGMKSFSIKDALLKSEKAKVSSEGIRYIVVPLPVKTPSKKGQGKSSSRYGGREMTQEMYNIVKGGGRLKTGSIGSVDVSGLTKYNTRQRHGQYGIFRCVTDKSKGWIHPGVAPNPVMQSVLKEANKQMQEVLSAFCRAVVQKYSQ